MGHFSVIREDVKAAEAHAPGSVAMVREPISVNAWHIILPATIAIALATAAECHSITDLDSVRYGFTLSGWWGLTALAIWHIGKRWPASLRMATVPLLLHTVAAAILGVGHLLWMAAADDLFSHVAWLRKELTWHHYLDLNRWGLEMLVYGFIFGVAAVTRLQLQAQRNAFQSLELQRALTAAQLHALQAQVEPHFLFNTLNSITELVESGHKQQATDMLKHLNTILKMTLRRPAPQKISLAQELDVVENYLAIEQVRFADRLRIEFRIDPSALNALIPSFLLQPLMENAIRHGIGQSEKGGMIQTFVERKDDMLYLRILDDGSGPTVEKPEGHGIGLSNTATRLAHFYPDRHSFHAKPEEHGGFQVRIAIPYETVTA
ncbi:MAG: signal transduction histidine kinase, LytS [Acidobacteriaceae bacterium]|nr:signal transduction histidine kinase, LytS [Acidobacteriaceae bacterium]